MTSASGRTARDEGQVSYPAAFAILGQALDVERRHGLDDSAVKGGLDRLLDRLRSERRLPPGSPLARAVADLLQTGYASLPHDGREHWVGTLSALLQRERLQLEQSVAKLQKRSATVAVQEDKPKKQPVQRTSPSRALESLDVEVSLIGGVNRAIFAKLQSLGITTVRDLLYHFPHRYDDFSQIRPIAELIPGEQQTLVATIWSAAEKRLGRRNRATEMIVGDATGNIRAVFFNQPYLAKLFHTGGTIVLSGRVSIFKHQRQMDSPEWELLDKAELERAVHTGRLVPVYPLTTGLSARTLRRTTREALDRGAGLLEESLPASVRERHRLMPLPEAIREIHYPGNAGKAEAARRRLAFEELLSLQLAVLGERRKRLETGHAQPLRLEETAAIGFLDSLPFGLTGAQLRATAEVGGDLATTQPMARLLQGDVGSGKTVVAAIALLAAVQSGRQAVMMAPTEILAEQHFRTLCRLLNATADLTGPAYRAEPQYLGVPVRIGLLHGGMPARAKAAAQIALANGDIEIAVGTQALIQESIQIPRLGLAIVDEQHRFGVMQRAALREKGLNAHLLVMTATPIPRTLALTLYGDLEISVIDEMPPGRKPINTRFVQTYERDHAYRFAREQIDAGRQAFVICPLVEESEKLETRAAVEEYERLREHDVFSGIEIALLHGRMNTKEKDAIMRAFAAGESQILVSTAVVEVGIDVPNASVILIEGADRFGLAQLHQFRGRVGRGADQSYCLLLADNPSPEASERLKLMEQTQDGFELAEADLKLRGPGEYFGTRQSGLPELRVARLTDVALLAQTREEAGKILDVAPSLEGQELDSLRRQVERLRRGGGEMS
jgi:ATP-dependent DNA helicase RecG